MPQEFRDPTPDEINAELERQYRARLEQLTAQIKRGVEDGHTEIDGVIAQLAAISVQCDHAVGLIVRHQEEEHKPRRLIEIPGRR